MNDDGSSLSSESDKKKWRNNEKSDVRPVVDSEPSERGNGNGPKTGNRRCACTLNLWRQKCDLFLTKVCIVMYERSESDMLRLDVVYECVLYFMFRHNLRILNYILGATTFCFALQQ